MTKWKVHIIAGFLTLAIGVGIFYLLVEPIPPPTIPTPPDEERLGAMLPFITATSSHPVMNEKARGPNYTVRDGGRNSEGNKLDNWTWGVGWINALTENGWETLEGKDRFVETVDGFELDAGLFTVVAPLRSTGVATFTDTNRWDWGLRKQINAPYISETILAEGVADVAGVIEEDILIEGQYVRYVDAYPFGDLIYRVVMATIPKLDKLVYIKSTIAVDEDVSFLFTTSEPYVLYEDVPENVAAGQGGTIRGNDRRIKRGGNSITTEFPVIWKTADRSHVSNLRAITMQPPKIWDATSTLPIEYTIDQLSAKQFRLTKHVKLSYFDILSVPVFTDIIRHPASGTGSTSVDGQLRRDAGGGEPWATIHAGDGTSADTGDTEDWGPWVRTHGTVIDEFDLINIAVFNFDTSDIPDSHGVDSGIFSTVYTGALDQCGLDSDLGVTEATTATDNDLATSDFQNTITNHTTRFATDLDATDVTANGVAYTDYILNASGVANITVTGVSKFANRVDLDIDDSDACKQNPALERNIRMAMDYADTSGLVTDPKLNATTSVAAVAAGSSLPAFFLNFF